MPPEDANRNSGISMTAERASAIAARRAAGRIRILTGLLLVLPGAQYLLGMATLFYALVPSDHPGVHPSNYFVGVVQSVAWSIPNQLPWLGLHAALGLLLILGALILLVLTIGARHEIERGAHIVWIAALIGLCGTIGAGFNGASYLIFGNVISSFIMAILFLIPLGADIAILAAIR